MCYAIPAKIVYLDGDEAKVDYGGVFKTVNVSLVEAKIDDYILIHAGFAIEKIDSETAAKSLEAIKEFIEEIEKNNK